MLVATDRISLKNVTNIKFNLTHVTTDRISAKRVTKNKR